MMYRLGPLFGSERPSRSRMRHEDRQERDRPILGKRGMGFGRIEVETVACLQIKSFFTNPIVTPSDQNEQEFLPGVAECSLGIHLFRTHHQNEGFHQLSPAASGQYLITVSRPGCN